MDAHGIAGTMQPRSTRAEQRHLLAWLAIGVLAALLGYFAFRGYLSSDLLFQFGNALHC
jgi:hypothetical protein